MSAVLAPDNQLQKIRFPKADNTILTDCERVSCEIVSTKTLMITSVAPA